MYHAKGCACVHLKSAAGCRWGGFKCRSLAQCRCKGEGKADWPDRQQKLHLLWKKKKNRLFSEEPVSEGKFILKKRLKTDLWSVIPNLYIAYDRICFDQNGESSDIVSQKNRFRRFEMKDYRLILNKSIVFKGVVKPSRVQPQNNADKGRGFKRHAPRWNRTTLMRSAIATHRCFHYIRSLRWVPTLYDRGNNSWITRFVGCCDAWIRAERHDRSGDNMDWATMMLLTASIPVTRGIKTRTGSSGISQSEMNLDGGKYF